MEERVAIQTEGIENVFNEITEENFSNLGK
jgi:hypothetical protein